MLAQHYTYATFLALRDWKKKSILHSVHLHHYLWAFLFPFLGRLSVPELTVHSGEDHDAYFLCVSEGNTKPTIKWYKNEEHIR